MHLMIIISTLHTERGEIDEAIRSFERSLATETGETTAQAVTGTRMSRSHIGIISKLQSLCLATDDPWERKQLKLAVRALLRLDAVRAEARQTGSVEHGRAYGSS
jgi:hypothetical protein